MAADTITVRQIIEILSAWIPDVHDRHNLAAALYAKVKGNKSVMITIKMLKDATQADLINIVKREDS
jgi:hypothetical protein